MDFNFTAEEEAFRQEVKNWFKENLPPDWVNPEVSLPEDHKERFEWLRSFQRKLHDKGWAGLTWPKEYGGKGASLMEQLIFEEEMARAEAPPIVGRGGIALLGPTLMHHGTEEQKKRFLPKILSAEEIWCQGFSEPNAGSDLASLNTRAVRDGDDYVLNGQKIWTSNAHFAHWCFILVRTDPDAPKHKGISFLLMDMKSPGITIRPLIQMTGSPEFGEVYLEDVRVPVKNLVGEENRGWYTAMTTLGYERGRMFSALVMMQQNAARLVELAKKTKYMGRPAIEDSAIRQKIARAYIEAEVFRLTTYRGISRIIREGKPGPENSVLKLFYTEKTQEMTETALEIEGPFSVLDRGSERAIDGGGWQFQFLKARGLTIAGGTSEILKNVVAERVLGLPKGR
jgi:alkylation response protein AidB-like acyl-CoA dehydrogenase